MNIGVLGTGMVGNAIGTKLISLGHHVMMGSRTASNEKASAWVTKCGPNASAGTFADAARFGEIVWNCTNGAGSLDALNAAGAEHLRGKLLVDISNPLDFSKGMPPSLFVCNTDSLAEQIQRAFPDTHVVKTLNTVSCNLMVDPSLLGESHDMLYCGNDADAKKQVHTILTTWFGWKHVHDLGDLTGARAMEMWLPLWLRLWGAVGSTNFNLHVAK